MLFVNLSEALLSKDEWPGGSLRRQFLAVGAIVAFSFLLSCKGHSASPPQVPTLNLAEFLPAVRDRISPVYDVANASPNDATTVGRLGMILDAHEQYQSAAACYERAHQLDRNSFRWAYYLGSVQLALGKPGTAISSFQEALRIQPDYLPAQLKLAESLLNANRLEESKKKFDLLIRHSPNSASAYLGLGKIFARMGKPIESVEAYLKACELFPPYGSAHYALSLAYRKQGDASAADSHLKAYERNKMAAPLEADPLLAEVRELNAGAMLHLRQAAVLEQGGRLAEAAAEEERALLIDPQMLQAHVNLISLYGKLGQLAKAKQHYDLSIAGEVKPAEAYYNYGVLVYNLNNVSEAEWNFRQALRINPNHAPAHHNLGVLLEQRNQLALALAEYKAATASQAEYPLAHFHAGRILASKRRYEEAAAHFLRALQPEDEHTAAYLYALAATYARQGKRAEALLYARRASKLAAQFGQPELEASIAKDLVVLERP